MDYGVNAVWSEWTIEVMDYGVKGLSSEVTIEYGVNGL